MCINRHKLPRNRLLGDLSGPQDHTVNIIRDLTLAYDFCREHMFTHFDSPEMI